MGNTNRLRCLGERLSALLDPPANGSFPHAAAARAAQRHLTAVISESPRLQAQAEA